ncbi:cytochrome c oxidase accessory protein CcoG [Psychromonas sp. SP041]|uniref:cytochrome c oxidase accessory protein CcoG n=1 Tax=Psychromonas sp. SP041 TaxID=1365007 RepID=UPI0010C78751|nr:cytochrome c oxidase accessory protein CcoG [Psychromonas sp. SP041]
MTQRIKIKEIKSTHKNSADRFNPSNRIYVRAVYGFFQKLRKFTGWGLISFFIAMPMIRWDGHQAVLFDVDKQQFQLFDMLFFPQDLTLVAWVFIIAAFALFFFTTYLGRVWCGYTCPQTVWTFIFIWFEERFEGTANKRKRLDEMPWDFNKVWRKTAKHTGWLAVSLLTGLAFCSYFVPVEKLYTDFFTGQSSMLVLIMIFIFTFSTYANAGWMRSIFCVHMCPYSRFQSAMFDKNTYSVGYDATRGEKRGPRSRKVDRSETGLGDCVDCDLCVQVCPTGIDIRDGLQYECINCGACIDACDQTMDKMGYPRGLISYTSEQVLEGKETKLLRPKIIGYGLVLLLMVGLFIVNLSTLTNAEMEILRDRNSLYRENVDGLIENTYTLKVINKSTDAQAYRITFTGLKDATLIGPKQITIQSGEVFTQPISIAVDPYDIKAKKITVTIKLTNVDNNEVIEQDASFFLGL